MPSRLPAGRRRYVFTCHCSAGFSALSPICRTLPSSSDICMPESVSNSAGTCAAILVMSPVILFMPGGIAVAGGNDGDLVDVGQRRGQRAHHFRHAGDQLVDDRRLVVFLVGLGLHVHGLGFGFALLEDDLGFGFALRADGGGVTFGFRDQALLLGLGQRLDALALDFGLLQHGGDQFLLAAHDFGFLHLDLLLLLDLLHLHRLGDSPAAA